VLSRLGQNPRRKANICGYFWNPDDLCSIISWRSEQIQSNTGAFGCFETNRPGFAGSIYESELVQRQNTLYFHQKARSAKQPGAAPQSGVSAPRTAPGFPLKTLKIKAEKI